jgi:hypothetical protein
MSRDLHYGPITVKHFHPTWPETLISGQVHYQKQVVLGTCGERSMIIEHEDARARISRAFEVCAEGLGFGNEADHNGQKFALQPSAPSNARSTLG